MKRVINSVNAADSNQAGEHTEEYAVRCENRNGGVLKVLQKSPLLSHNVEKVGHLPQSFCNRPSPESMAFWRLHQPND